MNTKKVMHENDNKTSDFSEAVSFPTMKIIERHTRTKPTHDVRISPSFGQRLMDICDRSNTNISEEDIPADILFSKTVPMTDFEMEIIDNSATADTIHPMIRVVLLDDYQARVDDIDLNDTENTTILGAVMYTYNKPINMSLYVVFGVTPDEDIVSFPRQMCIAGCKSVIDYKSKMKRLGELMFSELQMHKLTRSILKMWYGVQISLLNPVMKAGFHKETILEEKPINPSKASSKKKPPIKYKKVVYLNDAFIDNNEPVKRIFSRKTAVWYVTGHWRWQATKDGHKRIFIQGYWKGVARNTKQAEERERIVCTSNMLQDENNENE